MDVKIQGFDRAGHTYPKRDGDCGKGAKPCRTCVETSPDVSSHILTNLVDQRMAIEVMFGASERRPFHLPTTLANQFTLVMGFFDEFRRHVR